MEDKNITVVLGSDHGGFKAKEIVKTHLINCGYNVIDVGTNSSESCNYAYFALEAAKKVSKNEAQFGILICNSGEGVSIAANKVKGVRCGIGYNDDVARLIRQHNDCNMVSFGASFMSIEDILRRVDIFLNTDFEGGRHCLRVNTFVEYENNN